MIRIPLNNEKDILKFHYDNITKKVGREWNVEIRLQKRMLHHAGNVDLEAMYQNLLNSLLKDTAGFSILTATPKELSIFSELFNLTLKF